MLVLKNNNKKNVFFLVEDLLADNIANDDVCDDTDEIFGKPCDEKGNPLSDEWVAIDLSCDWSRADGVEEPDEED